MELRTARDMCGITQACVAREAGISETQYQNIEYDKSEPGVKTAIRIAKALNKETGDMETLFGEKASNLSVRE